MEHVMRRTLFARGMWAAYLRTRFRARALFPSAYLRVPPYFGIRRIRRRPNEASAQYIYIVYIYIYILDLICALEDVPPQHEGNEEAGDDYVA
jgi:hypothetical protein